MGTQEELLQGSRLLFCWGTQAKVPPRGDVLELPGRILGAQPDTLPETPETPGQTAPMDRALCDLGQPFLNTAPVHTVEMITPGPWVIRRIP